MLKVGIKKRQIPLYLFLVLFCYLFVFQYAIRSYIDEALIMVLVPLFCYGRKGAFKLKGYMIPVFLMVACILIWSTEGHQSFVYYAIMLEAIFCIRPEVDDLNLILRVIKRTALINAFFIVFQRIFPSVMTAYARLIFSESAARGYISAIQKGYYSGLNNQVSFAAVYLSLGIFAYTYDKRHGGRKRLAKLAFLWLALLLTNKRSHLLYLLVSMLVIYYAGGVQNRRIQRALKVVFLVLILTGLLYLATYLFPNVTILNRIGVLLSAVFADGDINVALSGRAAIYTQVLQLFKENKLFGIGWQNFVDFSRYRSMTGGVNQGHNVFLQLLCETGIVGFVCFISINLYYLISNFHTQFRLVNHKRTTCDARTQAVLKPYAQLSIGFMVFYYLFWFSGNALYDFPFVYMWILSIIIGQTIKKRIAG